MTSTSQAPLPPDVRQRASSNDAAAKRLISFEDKEIADGPCFAARRPEDGNPADPESRFSRERFPIPL
jgi:hypothetical protein